MQTNANWNGNYLRKHRDRGISLEWHVVSRRIDIPFAKNYYWSSLALARTFARPDWQVDLDRSSRRFLIIAGGTNSLRIRTAFSRILFYPSQMHERGLFLYLNLEISKTFNSSHDNFGKTVIIRITRLPNKFSYLFYPPIRVCRFSFIFLKIYTSINFRTWV